MIGRDDNLGARLRALRRRTGLSQEALAQRSGIGVATLAALERNERHRPHPSTLAALADALGLQPSERQRLTGSSSPDPVSQPPGFDDGPVGALAALSTSLVGREQALNDVLGLLGRSRLVTLTGAGGVGKTRLALAAASAIHQQYADGVRLVLLGPVTDPALVPQVVASGVGVLERGRRSVLTSLTEALRDRRVLLVLDNCEHLVEACAELIAAILTHCRELAVMATSREALGLPVEVTWRVPSLSVPRAASPGPHELLECQAARLFIERAQAIRPEFKVTAANAPAIAEVCQRLDGIPLAIELAAAWVEVLNVEEIAARLDDRFRLLVSGSRAAPPRQQTLRGAIEWSYDLLSPAERRLFAALSVFDGGWTTEAVEVVCADAEMPRETVLYLLRQLVGKSLVVVDQTADGPRLRLLETLRAYARERAQATGDLANVEKRHTAWCLELAEMSPPQQLDPAHISLLARETDNLRTALRRCIENRESAIGLRLGVALWPYWYVRGLYTEGYSWLKQLTQLPRAGRADAMRARALAFAGHLACCRGDYVTADALLEDALATAKAVGDEQGVAIALQLLGTPARARGYLDRAQSLFERARVINRQLGSRVWEAMTLGNLAMSTADAGDHPRAKAYATEALRTYTEQHHTWGVARMREVLARLAVTQGDATPAFGELEETVAFQRTLEDRQGLVFSLPTLARVVLGQGHTARAGELLAEGLQLAHEADDRLALARGIEAIATLVSDHQPQRAVRLAEAAAALREALGAELTPADHEQLARWQTKALRQLGQAGLGPVEGVRQTFEDAYAEALEAARTVASLPADAPALHQPAPLTRREQEVAALVAKGLTNQQIGHALTISEATARTHVQRVLEKLGVNSRTLVASVLRERGLVEEA